MQRCAEGWPERFGGELEGAHRPVLQDMTRRRGAESVIAKHVHQIFHRFENRMQELKETVGKKKQLIGFELAIFTILQNNKITWHNAYTS